TTGTKTGANTGTTVNTKEPCGYEWRFLKERYKTKCYVGKEFYQVQDIYETWSVAICGLEKGHSGAHEGTVDHTVTVKIATIPCGDSTGKDLPTHGGTPVRTITKDSLDKIPTSDSAKTGLVKTGAGKLTLKKNPCGYQI